MNASPHLETRKSLRYFSIKLAGTAIGAALIIAPITSAAETRIRGTLEFVSIVAHDASVEEILTALAQQFNIRARSSANLNKRITGTYEGPASQALAHLLKGYNFLMKSGVSGIEVTILGFGKEVAEIGASSPLNAGQTPSTDHPESSPRHSNDLQTETGAREGGAIQAIKPSERTPVVPVAVPPRPGSAFGLLPGPPLGAGPILTSPEPGAPQALNPEHRSVTGGLRPPAGSAPQ
jgi:hypothetical protein